MYSHPRNNRGGRGRPSRAGGAVIAVFLAVVVANWLNEGRKRGGSAPQVSPPAPAVPTRPGQSGSFVIEQVQAMMAPPAGIERREGTAVAVLVDTSGSMSEAVADGPGKAPKIDIAKRCLRSLIDQCVAFAGQHPDKPLLVGAYEFSARKGEPAVRLVIPIGPASVLETQALDRMRPSGNTPIGDAMVAAKKDLDKTGLFRTHILVLTDGENNRGIAPSVVAQAIAGLPEESRSAIYFVAFDVAASRFNAVRDAGGLVLPASSGTELAQALDYILTGRILAEQPEPPRPGDRTGR